MTIEDVKVFLTENQDKKEIIDLLSGFAKVSPEKVAEYLATDEGKKLVRTHPVADERVTEAIQKHDAKIKASNEAEVKRLVAIEIARLNPEETPEQKRIRELEIKDELREKQFSKANIERQLMEEATRRGVDVIPFLQSGYSPESFEQGVLVIQSLEKTLKSHEEKVRNDLHLGLKKPGSGQGDRDKVDPNKLTFDQAVALEKDGKLDSVLSA